MDFERFRKASKHMTEKERAGNTDDVEDLIRRTEHHVEQLRRDLATFESTRRSAAQGRPRDASRKRPQHDAT